MGTNLGLEGRPTRDMTLLDRARQLVVHFTQYKFIRYCIASAVAVVCGQAALFLFAAGLGWPGIPANLGSVAVGAVPNYLINRYWTWQQTGKNRLWGEIVPFWTIAFLGMVLSTLAVDYADNRWGTPLSLAIAQLSGFGVLWFGRFLILDKVMWRVIHDLHPEVELADQSG